MKHIEILEYRIFCSHCLGDKCEFVQFVSTNIRRDKYTPKFTCAQIHIYPSHIR